MFSTNSTEMPIQKYSDDVPQGVLYIPSVLVAVSLIIFLGISFVRYHLRMIAKRNSSKDYVIKNLHIKRDRIRGYITPSATFLPNNSAASDASTEIFFINDSYHAMPFDQHQEHFADRGMDLNKPQTPHSAFDSDSSNRNIPYRHRFKRTESSPQFKIYKINENGSSFNDDMGSQISLPNHRYIKETVPLKRSNSKSNKNVTIKMPDFDHNVVIPFGSLCNDCKLNVNGKMCDAHQGQVNMGFIPDKIYSNDLAYSDDTVDDAFHESNVRHIQKIRGLLPERAIRKKSLNSRTFPDADIKMGVLKIGS